MITVGDLGDSIWLTAFLVAVSGLLFLFVLGSTWMTLQCVMGRDRFKRMLLGGLASAFPLGLTGIVCGFLTGSSKSPAVSALIPAVLTLIGLMVVYLIGRGALRSTLAGLAVFVFSINILAGTFLGTNSRNRYEEAKESVDVQKAKALQELAVRLFRTGLGLPPEAPKQIVVQADTK